MKTGKMKATLTSKPKNKTYRKSTGISRVKKTGKAILKGAAKVLSPGLSNSFNLSLGLAKFSTTPPKNSPAKLKKSPALAKLSASCKAAARRKFKVYPSAYANMWASKTQKKGKC